MKLKELLKFVSAPEYTPAPPYPKGIWTDKQWSVSYRGDLRRAYALLQDKEVRS